MMCVQGWQKRSGRSGFGRTTFSLKQKKKKKFLVGFDQCGFTAWQRKSSKYSNNTMTVTPVLLQHASDNRSSVVSSTGLGVLHWGAGMRSRLGCGSACAYNTCSVTTCMPKSTRSTKHSPPILLYYVYYSISIYMYTAYAHFARTVHMLWPDHLNIACSGPGVNLWCQMLWWLKHIRTGVCVVKGACPGQYGIYIYIYIYSTKCIEQCMQIIQAWE